jgi:hypothetical protein
MFGENKRNLRELKSAFISLKNDYAIANISLNSKLNSYITSSFENKARYVKAKDKLRELGYVMDKFGNYVQSDRIK